MLWFKFKKDESTHRLLFVGFLVIIISSWMDFVGTMYGLWFYTGKPIPTMPSYVPWDYSLLPVMVMLLLQYKPASSPFLKALIFAGVSSFIGEPLFQWIGIYVMTNWKIYYSFPIYFFIYLLSHKVSRVNMFEKL